MSTLIVINGPPAVGKSTMARMYADEHLLALRIDVDHVRDWLGGWRQVPHEAGLRARALASALASDHLRAGHDVVLAQLYGQVDHLDELRAVAEAAGASYHEVVLMSDLESTLERFTRRGGPRLAEALDAPEGLDAIAELHRRVQLVARNRSHAIVVPMIPDDVAATYQAVITALRDGA